MTYTSGEQEQLIELPSFNMCLTFHLTSRKASLKRDKMTYISGEQEQLIELSSFNMYSTLQSL
jgi:hypothetical protein